MDFLMRDGAILNPEQWTELDAVVVKTAKTGGCVIFCGRLVQG